MLLRLIVYNDKPNLQQNVVTTIVCLSCSYDNIISLYIIDVNGQTHIQQIKTLFIHWQIDLLTFDIEQLHFLYCAFRILYKIVLARNQVIPYKHSSPLINSYSNDNYLNEKVCLVILTKNFISSFLEKTFSLSIRTYFRCKRIF